MDLLHARLSPFRSAHSGAAAIRGPDSEATPDVPNVAGEGSIAIKAPTCVHCRGVKVQKSVRAAYTRQWLEKHPKERADNILSSTDQDDEEIVPTQRVSSENVEYRGGKIQPGTDEHGPADGIIADNEVQVRAVSVQQSPALSLPKDQGDSDDYGCAPTETSPEPVSDNQAVQTDAEEATLDVERTSEIQQTVETVEQVTPSLVSSAESVHNRQHAEEHPMDNSLQPPARTAGKVAIDLTNDDEDDLVIVKTERISKQGYQSYQIRRGTQQSVDDLDHELERIRRRKRILELEEEEDQVMRKKAIVAKGVAKKDRIKVEKIEDES